MVFVWHKALWDLEIEVGQKETTVWAHNRKTDTMFSGPLDEQWPKLSRLLSYLAWHRSSFLAVFEFLFLGMTNYGEGSSTRKIIRPGTPT